MSSFDYSKIKLLLSGGGRLSVDTYDDNSADVIIKKDCFFIGCEYKGTTWLRRTQQHLYPLDRVAFRQGFMEKVFPQHSDKSTTKQRYEDIVF